eukprot:gene5144-6982_t
MAYGLSASADGTLGGLAGTLLAGYFRGANGDTRNAY